jgi:hypothetical protein
MIVIAWLIWDGTGGLLKCTLLVVVVSEQ